jgi:hypothetical protein
MLNQSSHYLLVGIQGEDGTFLILSHETAVTLYIRIEDGCELTFNFLRSHGVSPKNSIKGRGK